MLRGIVTGQRQLCLGFEQQGLEREATIGAAFRRRQHPQRGLGAAQRELGAGQMQAVRPVPAASSMLAKIRAASSKRRVAAT